MSCIRLRESVYVLRWIFLRHNSLISLQKHWAIWTIRKSRSSSVQVVLRAMLWTISKTSTCHKIVHFYSHSFWLLIFIVNIICLIIFENLPFTPVLRIVLPLVVSHHHGYAVLVNIKRLIEISFINLALFDVRIIFPTMISRLYVLPSWYKVKILRLVMIMKMTRVVLCLVHRMRSSQI